MFPVIAKLSYLLFIAFALTLLLIGVLNNNKYVIFAAVSINYTYYELKNISIFSDSCLFCTKG